MDSDFLYSRDAPSVTNGADRPPAFKAIGIGLAIGSGAFIGTSFVLKKVGLLRANEKYKEIPGEGYGYLRNAYWWSGMILMIIGEICNFVAYCFTDAILVTPLGALSVVITAILSAIFLKERLSMVGKVACFLCIVGSIVIVMNAPTESSVKNIEQMQGYVITPGFLTYAGLIIVGSFIVAWYVGPRWGKKNMLVYISICSWIGGLSVVATQGLGASIVAWIGGEEEYKHWFLWVLFVFVIATLLTEIVFLNKALNLFNAAMVTPTYYVYFTSTTIITSAILFQGFKGTVQSIITVVLGFLTICSGVVLLQLSKSAKDVPDAAVFTGDLDQIQTIAEQEQPESEPKADAIRGTAAIMRQLSTARQKMEADELRRMHNEKRMESMEPISEDGQPRYEWDGIRRRRTVAQNQRARATTSPTRMQSPPPPLPTGRSQHPPLGMSQFPSSEDEDEEEEADNNSRPNLFASIAGTLRGRSRTNASMPTYEDEYLPRRTSTKAHSPLHPVPLTEINVAHDQSAEASTSYFGRPQDRPILPRHQQSDTEYRGASRSGLSSAGKSHITKSAGASASSLVAPPSGHGAKRQFSFQRVFRKHSGPSEEERVGLVRDSDIEGEAGSGRNSGELAPSDSNDSTSKVEFSGDIGEHVDDDVRDRNKSSGSGNSAPRFL